LCSPRSRLIAHRSSSLPQSRPVPWTTRLRARFSVISPLMCSLLPSLRVAGVNWGSGLTIAPGRFLRRVLRRWGRRRRRRLSRLGKIHLNRWIRGQRVGLEHRDPFCVIRSWPLVGRSTISADSGSR
jgi:hypothetical protein